MTRILAEQGVDETIAYMESRRGSVLQTARSRAAAVRERNRADLEPLLRTAALYQTKDQDAEARALYTDILAIEPDWPEALHATFWFLTDHGDLARIRTTLAAAQHDYEEAHRIAQRLTSEDQGNTQWQRDLSVSHSKIGDVLVAQGDGPRALTAYRTGLAIGEALATRDPTNTQRQHDLGISNERIGDVLVTQGDLNGAMAAYRKKNSIVESLVKRDPENTQWQRDLAVSHSKIGDVLVAQGDLSAALTAYRTGLAIGEALAARDPANVQWQVDVAVSCAKLGTHAGIAANERRSYLQRGLKIQQNLKTSGRLAPNQDWIGWFTDRLKEIK